MIKVPKSRYQICLNFNTSAKDTLNSKYFNKRFPKKNFKIFPTEIHNLQKFLNKTILFFKSFKITIT